VKEKHHRKEESIQAILNDRLQLLCIPQRLHDEPLHPILVLPVRP
jgi:hypothetical protein